MKYPTEHERAALDTAAETRRRGRVRLIHVSTVGLLMALFTLIFVLMGLVRDLQGTARVVNYAGLVRGLTQRMVKLEMAGHESEQLMVTLDGYLDGIRDGSAALGLRRIDDADYQAALPALGQEWEGLKATVRAARTGAAGQEELLALSERYFERSDEVVGLAERYSQRLASRIATTEVSAAVLMGLLLCLMVWQMRQALHVRRDNRALRSHAFVDVHTGLPNRNRCEQLLRDAPPFERPSCCMMFDLNNLKQVNDTRGHQAGDELIRAFAEAVRAAVPASQFVGRYGGDEFIAVLTGAGAQEAAEVIARLRARVKTYNDEAAVPIRYAVGFSCGERGDGLRAVLAHADSEMYRDKKAASEAQV